MNELLQYIAELLEQIRALLGRPAQAQGSTPNTPAVSDVRIVDTPVPVRLTSATVQAELDEPIAVEQSGSWTVNIGGQPVGVNVINSPTVNIGGQPIQVTITTPTRKYASISANTAGNTQLVAAVSGKRIRVVSYVIVASGAVSVQFRSGANTNLTGAMRLVEAGGVSAHFDGGLFQTAVGEPLNLNLSAAVQVSGHLTYEEV